ncbi:hypothetical protein D3C85_1084280 [compost metagenome]
MGEVGIDAGVVSHAQQAFVGPQAQRARQVDLAVFKTEVPAFERAQTIAAETALAGLQLHRQRQVFETQAVRHMVEELQVQWLRKIVLKLQSYLTPATQGQAAGHVPLQAR